MVVKNTRKRKELGSRQINNIGDANVVILKWPISNKTKDNVDDLPIYSIIAATQSQKLATPQASRFKNSQPTISRIAKPAAKKNLK